MHFGISPVWDNKLFSFTLTEFHEFRSNKPSQELKNDCEFLTRFFNTFRLAKIYEELSERFKTIPGVLSVIDKGLFEKVGKELEVGRALLYSDFYYYNKSLVKVQGIWMAPSLLNIVRYEIARCILLNLHRYDKLI